MLKKSQTLPEILFDHQLSDHQLYGHYRSRPLKAAQRKAVETILPPLEIKPETLRDPHALFDFKPDHIWLEIGFGAGEHLLRMARAHRHIGFIGCEPYLNGCARLLAQLDAKTDKNIRLYAGDVRDILPKFAPETIERIILLHPDPWPKRRHHARRLIQSDLLDICAAIMTPRAELHFSSDEPVLTAWVLAHILAHRRFDWHDPICACRPCALEPQTRYEAKALKQGRHPARLVFCRAV